MNEFPKIDFAVSSSGDIEFEIFTLQSLFLREPILDVSLESPHRLNFYMLVFISKGAGTHIIDFQPYKHLNEICKRITGRTVKKCIDNHVILEMKRRLASSDISIKELAYITGFDEPTNLVKYFKKYTNQSPSQFKRRLLG
ncbi:helix-turn-helix domain-containing protein [Planctomycetota bacterium]